MKYSDIEAVIAAYYARSGPGLCHTGSLGCTCSGCAPPIAIPYDCSGLVCVLQPCICDSQAHEPLAVEAPDDEPMATDYIHNRAREVIRDITSGSLGSAARTNIRRALDAKEAPPTREQARDNALGRALRFSR